jgi:hypothetical protein
MEAKHGGRVCVGGQGFSDLDLGGGANVLSMDRGGNSKWD